MRHSSRITEIANRIIIGLIASRTITSASKSKKNGARIVYLPMMLITVKIKEETKPTVKMNLCATSAIAKPVMK